MKKWTLVAIGLFMLTACQKDDDISYCELHPDECVDVREVKDYFYFKMGSWWVYEEEHTGNRDSVYVNETWTDTSSVLFSTELISSYDEYEYRFWTTGVNGSLVDNNLTKKKVKSTRVKRSKGKSGDYVDEQTCFLFYPYEGLATTTSYISGAGVENYHIGKLEIEKVFENYVVNDLEFHQVVFVSEEFTSIYDGQPTNHFYAPHIGLIRKELIDSNQVWNLVSYHINQ
jgi:hypothetical protein